MRRIGEVAAATGLTVRTLHHYDEIGLLRPSERSDAGYRLYSDADVRRLYRIVAFRRLDFALDEIGALLDTAAPTRGP
jgi:MerR family transcriptional regulator, thiopeptide resistance regulator